MKKILNFFSQVGERAIGLGAILGRQVQTIWSKIWPLIFRKRVEEERRAKLTKRFLISAVAVIIIVLIILLGWYIIGLFNKNKYSQESIANPIAQVKVYLVTTHSCGNKCWDTGLFLDALTQRNIKINDTETLYVGWWPWSRGREFVKEYDVSKLPTVVVEFQGQTGTSTDNFFSPALGKTIGDRFILTQILAPYYDLSANKLKGLIKVTYLADKSCTECYDVKNHETALKNLGVDIKNSRTVDVSSAEGKALIDKYKITKVPTMIITGEVGEYKLLTQAWGEVGTIAADGAYVFTAVNLMGDSYKDLTTGKVIKSDPAKYMQGSATSTSAGN
jgi:hypothetical protein